jgi:hypothetical protein
VVAAERQLVQKTQSEGSVSGRIPIKSPGCEKCGVR